MENLTEKYSITLEEGIEQKVKVIATNSHQYFTDEILKLIFRSIDLTSLNTDDNEPFIEKLCHKVNLVPSTFEGVRNVAAVCVYPPLVETVRKNLEDESVHVASVGGNFPTSQTYLSIKKAECKEIINHGADEVDVVLPVATFLQGDYESVFREIKEIKEAIGNNKLKVILETGMLNDYSNIQLASLLAMEAGADFIKTSTGKTKPAATYDAVYIMAHAIKAFYKHTGKTTGIKPAGGIATAEDALSYYAIIKEILGDQWLNNSLFRIGASRLANDVLGHLRQEDVHHF